MIRRLLIELLLALLALLEYEENKPASLTIVWSKKNV